MQLLSNSFTQKLSLKNPGILNYLKTREKSSFDRLFIPSISTGDIYNLIDPNTNDDFGISNIGDFFIDFKFKDEIKINGVKIFSSNSCFPKSFDIEVDGKKVAVITEAVELNGPYKEMNIKFKSLRCNKVSFVQTGPNWDRQSNFLNIKRIEFLSKEKKYSKGVFTTMS